MNCVRVRGLREAWVAHRFPNSSADLESQRWRHSLAEADSLKALKLAEGPVDLPARAQTCGRLADALSRLAGRAVRSLRGKSQQREAADEQQVRSGLRRGCRGAGHRNRKRDIDEVVELGIGSTIGPAGDREDVGRLIIDAGWSIGGEVDVEESERYRT
jgi:hypothetical protein